MGKERKKNRTETPNPNVKDTLIEVVHEDGHSYFVNLLDNGEANYTAHISDDDGETIYPPNNEAVKKGAVILPKKATPYETDEKLIEEIQAFVHKYLEVSPDYEIFATYYILLSWVYDRLNTIPYLRALGDLGHGKSRFLDVIGKLCYRPIIMAGTVTPAPVFRLMGYWKGTIVYDEGDKKKNSDEGEDLIKIFNCGFERGKPVLRSNKDNPNDIEVFDPFGPKVISSRQPFDDQALESRCLTEIMKETSRDDIPILLPAQFYEEQEFLRQKLLYYRLKNWHKIDISILQKIELRGMERRLRQAVVGFTVLFSNNHNLMEKFRTFIKEYQLQLIQQRETSFDGMILQFLFRCWREDNKTENISAADIRAYLVDEQNLQHVTNNTIGKHLSALGLKTHQKKVDGRLKRVIEWEKENFEKLFKKYVSEYFLETKDGKQEKILVSTVSRVSIVSESVPDHPPAPTPLPQ